MAFWQLMRCNEKYIHSTATLCRENILASPHSRLPETVLCVACFHLHQNASGTGFLCLVTTFCDCWKHSFFPWVRLELLKNRIPALHSLAHVYFTVWTYTGLDKEEMWFSTCPVGAQYILRWIHSVVDLSIPEWNQSIRCYLYNDCSGFQTPYLLLYTLTN